MNNAILFNSTRDPITPKPFQFYWYGVTVPILVIFGTFGNITLVIIIARGAYWKRLKVYLITLGIVDTFLLPNALLMYPVRMWLLNRYPQDIGLLNKYMRGTKYIYGCLHFCLYAHLWVTAAITVERFLAICFPIRHKRMDTERLVWISVGIAVGMSVVCSIPRITSVILLDATDVVTNTTIKMPNFNGSFWIRLSIDLISNVIPLLILLVLSCRIIITIARQPALRQRSQTRTMESINERTQILGPRINIGGCSNREARMTSCPNLTRAEKNTQTSMIIGLIMTIFCYTSPVLLDIVEMISDDILNQRWFEKLSDVSNFLVILGVSMPFYTYALSSSDFRTAIARQIGTSEDTTEVVTNQNYAMVRRRSTDVVH